MLSKPEPGLGRGLVGEQLRIAIHNHGNSMPVLQLASEQGVISRADIVSLLGINDDKAYYLLRKLVEAGKLERRGQGKSTTYRKAVG